MWQLSRLFFFLFYFSSVATFSLSRQEEDERKNLGEQKFNEVVRNSEGSQCWREAVDRLNATCRMLSDLEQSRLAVSFANCHLEKSGRTTYPCTPSNTILECTKDMDSVAFQVSWSEDYSWLHGHGVIIFGVHCLRFCSMWSHWKSLLVTIESSNWLYNKLSGQVDLADVGGTEIGSECGTGHKLCWS